MYEDSKLFLKIGLEFAELHLKKNHDFLFFSQSLEVARPVHLINIEI